MSSEAVGTTVQAAKARVNSVIPRLWVA